MAILAACGASGSRPFAPLDSDGRHFRDAQGRAALLRGVNARVAGIFDVTFTDGRPPVEALPTFDEADAIRMHQLGFNLLRLPLSWSGIEPEPATFSSAYLEQVAELVEQCHRHQILVLLDLHQDAWSKEIGEDGAPLWAIVPPPERLLGGPLDDLQARRLSYQVQRAFHSFFTDNAAGLQERFAEMAAQLARRFRGHPGVLGYELFNEPIATDDELKRFYVRVAAAIRAEDPGHLIAFEPPVTRNLSGAALVSSTAFPVRGSVYAPHIYTAVFGGDTQLASGAYLEPLRDSMRGARDEAEAWRTPLLLGEFGIGPRQPRATTWLGDFLNVADEVLAGAALWLWKEQSQGRWGLFDLDGGGSWRERPEMIAAVSRPYVQAVGGDPRSLSWDGRVLSLALTGRSRSPAEHDVYWNRPGPVARCDGAVTPATLIDAEGSLYRIRCGGPGAHELRLEEP